MQQALRSIAFALVVSVVTFVPSYAERGSTPEDGVTLSPLVSSRWLSQVEQEIEASEYNVTWQTRTSVAGLNSAWHATNRGQGFRTYFTPDGFRVMPRLPDPPEWSWGLLPRAYGRGVSSFALEQAGLFPNENRIELDRGQVVEWLVNRPHGLKHGFVLHAPPDAGGRTANVVDPVFLDLAVTGTLTPALGEDGRSVRFFGSSDMGVLSYRDLAVRDATGRELPAWMETRIASGNWTIRLLVDDHGAAYPLEIDPLVTTASWVAEPDRVGSGMGISVDSAGDVNADGYDDVAVGAYRFDNGEQDEGQAYVYFGSASGLSSDPDWTFENDVVEACLGGAVGTAGDVNGDGYPDLIVGAAFGSCENAPLSPLGKAYVFYGSTDGVGLPSEPNWTAENNQQGSLFAGHATWAGDVNADGYDDVIIGANWYDNDQTDEGAAFLYLGSETGLTLDHAWMVEGNQSDSEFGYDASRAGDVNADGYDDVILGAYQYDNGEDKEGAAFLYLGTGSVTPAGAVPPDTPLTLDISSSHGLATLHLTWGASCLAGDIDYEVYEGELGDFSSHSPRFCSTGGQTSTSFLVPGGGARYYLVVPRSRSGEGSYGSTSGGIERGPGASACLVQAIGSCE